MTVVIDSDVLVDHLRARRESRALIAAAIRQGRPLVASTLSKIEVLAGVRPGEYQPVRTLLDALAWVPVTDAIAERAAELAHRFAAANGTLETTDFAIAATVEELGAELWTRKVEHFPMFPELQPPY